MPRGIPADYVRPDFKDKDGFFATLKRRDFGWSAEGLRDYYTYKALWYIDQLSKLNANDSRASQLKLELTRVQKSRRKLDFRESEIYVELSDIEEASK